MTSADLDELSLLTSLAPAVLVVGLTSPFLTSNLTTPLLNIDPAADKRDFFNNVMILIQLVEILAYLHSADIPKYSNHLHVF